MLTSGDEIAERRERLLEALRRVKALKGSPDIIRSITEALERLTEGPE